jgi:hypothetical protein
MMVMVTVMMMMRTLPVDADDLALVAHHVAEARREVSAARPNV